MGHLVDENGIKSYEDIYNNDSYLSGNASIKSCI